MRDTRPSRRGFLGQLAGGLGAACLAGSVGSPAGAEEVGTGWDIVDTHQHLWDLVRVNPPWLHSAPTRLRQRATNAEFLEASRGLKVVKAVYMEVDVAPEDQVAEAELVIELCRRREHPTVAAVIGGRPASEGFPEYVQRFKGRPEVKGLRQILAAGSGQEFFLRPAFVRGIRLLGEAGWSFDLCLPPGDLGDGVKLVEACPGTQFMLDHCGNADPKAFIRSSTGAPPSHDPEAWKRNITRLAARSNVFCKISGIVARVPTDWKAEMLAPVVDHCLDAFGPDRVVFGGDWPVCLAGATYREWVMALHEVIRGRSAEAQRKLWHDNAIRFYRLT